MLESEIPGGAAGRVKERAGREACHQQKQQSGAARRVVRAGMGCQASRQAGTSGENRPEELAKCAALSADVRWSWLRGHSLFSFPELRSLFNIFTSAVTAASTTVPQQQIVGSAPICSVEMDNNSNTNKRNRGRRSSTMRKRSKEEQGGVHQLLMMDKAQFLSLCEDSSNDTLLYRLGEVVGAFGSRLFDVLDEDGDGLLAFETFALGLSKLLKV